jgi:hypothetical protein
VRIDLFDFLDGLFKGVVHFFYNIVETLFRLARRPLSGPTRLVLLNQSKNVPQLSGSTFLLLAFSAFFAVHVPRYGDLDTEFRFSPIAIASNGIPTTAPQLDNDWVWLVVATGLAAAVIVDAALRLLLWSLLPKAAIRRRIVVSAAEYALAWPILALLLLSLDERTLPTLVSTLSAPSSARETALVMALFLLLSLPSAWQLASGLRRRLRRWPRAALLAGAMAAMAVLGLAATSAGARIGYRIVEKRMSEHAGAFEGGLLVLDVRCRVIGGRLQSGAVLWNRSEEPVVVESLDILVGKDIENGFVYARDVERADRYSASMIETAEAPLVLRSGEVRSLRLEIRDHAFGRDMQGRNCALDATRRDQGAATLEGLVMRGYPAVIEVEEGEPSR